MTTELQTETLTTDQKQQLRQYESTIKKARDSFVPMVAALHQIQTAKLFAPKFRKFGDYCRNRWDLSPAEISRYKKAGGVLADLEGFDILPANEGQCRIMATIEGKDSRRQVWEQVLELHADGNKISASLINKVISGDNADDDQEDEGRQPQPVKLASVALSHLQKLESIGLDKLTKDDRKKLSDDLVAIQTVIQALQADIHKLG